ncbi:MAG: AMP-dependent synthetase [Gammaproteobacteria bacterium]|nr:MAG: AMP-dependent synthetase [Gammaproteobacteria bacterium]
MTEFIKTTNIGRLMNQLGFKDYPTFHRWSVAHYPDFWRLMVDTLPIIFDKPYTNIVDLSGGIESPHWFPNAKLNITTSCFQANENAVAIIEKTRTGEIKKTSYGELNKLSNRVANSLRRDFKMGDNIAIIMPMNLKAVAIYLGIIKAGCCVVSIADSFASPEIAVRLRIANTKAVFTQDRIIHRDKILPLYEKIREANAPIAIVISAEEKLSNSLRQQDKRWEDFLEANETFTAISCDPHDYTNVLFSSGTTGEPKAIPWTQTTPIKCASDAYLHQNVQRGDVLCWPTSLGWMMGPWLIYASLINQAAMALYHEMPHGREFGQFVQEAGVTFLGVVPTLVRSWRDSACMEGLDWRAIKVFSSTGECSQAEDMRYLASLAHDAPVIEYCGGTEIGGAYITSTVIQPLAPAAFTTPTMGLDFTILDEKGGVTQNGEVAIIPPSIGLSTTLLNKNHHDVYYANMPTLASGQVLRRHGDQVEKCTDGFYRLHGRVDDTMKLGGIKTSSAEIESVLNTLPAIKETAAIAMDPPKGGPSQLIIYAVLKANLSLDCQQLKIDMQQAIKHSLNPLFKIHEVIITDALPRTASNKVMRRILRDHYLLNKKMP